MDSGEVFASLSVGTLLLASSGGVFLATGYCVPPTIENVGGSLQDFVTANNMQRYLIRSILIAYLPFLLLSTVTYHLTSSLTPSLSLFNPPSPISLGSRLTTLLRITRTVCSLTELCALAVFASVTPNEDYGLHYDAVRVLVMSAGVAMVLTVVMVKVCYRGNRYQRLSVGIKAGVLGLWALLRFVWPVLCSGEKAECLVDEVFFLPLFAVFHGSGYLDIGHKRLVVRNTNPKQFEKNVQRALQDRISRLRAHDSEDSSGNEL